MTNLSPFPTPGDTVLGGEVIASTIFNEDDYDYPLVLVLLLMPEAPLYHVGTVWVKPYSETGVRQYEWEYEPHRHGNIVPAVNGDVHPEIPGYVDLGGDY